MDQLAAMMGGAQPQGGQAEGGEQAQQLMQQLMQPPPRPATREPRLAAIEDFLVKEVLAKHRRDDLAPPEALLDTPSQTQFPIMEREEGVTGMSFGPTEGLAGMFGSAMQGLGEPVMGGGVDPLAALSGGGAPVAPPPPADPLAGEPPPEDLLSAEQSLPVDELM